MLNWEEWLTSSQILRLGDVEGLTESWEFVRTSCLFPTVSNIQSAHTVSNVVFSLPQLYLVGTVRKLTLWQLHKNVWFDLSEERNLLCTLLNVITNIQTATLGAHAVSRMLLGSPRVWETAKRLCINGRKLGIRMWRPWTSRISPLPQLLKSLEVKSLFGAPTSFALQRQSWVGLAPPIISSMTASEMSESMVLVKHI